MINLSLFWFLALLELLVVLLIAIGVLVWRLQRVRNRDRIEFIDGADDHPTPALYLEAEVAKTRTHLESLAAPASDGEADIAAGEDAAQIALNLRVALLEVEAELSESQPEERDAAYWQALADRLGEIVNATGYRIPQPEAPPAAPAAPAAAEPAPSGMEVEDASVTGLVEQQAKTIDFLRNYIQELLDQHGHDPSPDPQITGKFDELERANKELSSCVAVLEDENSFLRDQIAALLKMEA